MNMFISINKIRPLYSEYQDILKEMGYHEVRNSFDDFRVLENENVDAPDLIRNLFLIKIIK